MEGGAFIAITFLSSGEFSEVFGSLRNSLAVETNDNPSQVFITMGNIKVDLAGIRVN
jgi:hypothetical protein